MRLDLFLKRTGLLRQRSQAKDACEHGAVTVSGQPAKPGRSVSVGQRVRIAYPRRTLMVEILALPEGSVPRSDRHTYYRVLEDTARSWEE